MFKVKESSIEINTLILPLALWFVFTVGIFKFYVYFAQKFLIPFTSKIYMPLQNTEMVNKNNLDSSKRPLIDLEMTFLAPLIQSRAPGIASRQTCWGGNSCGIIRGIINLSSGPS